MNLSTKIHTKTKNRLFPPHLLHAAWLNFEAEGYSKPVTGVIYRGEPRPTCGMPLGGLDTGCLDIEPNGMLGYSTIFNHLIRPRLLLNLPFLGLHVGGKTWVLVTDKKAKIDTPTESLLSLTFPPTDYTPRYEEICLEGVQLADSIDYWGHYPILDMEYNTQAPVDVALRCWSPFLPGDALTSMLPGAVFQIILRNTAAEEQKGTLVFSFPGFELSPKAGANEAVRRQPLPGKLNGVVVNSGKVGDAWEMEYALAVNGEIPVRWGGPLNSDGAAWAAAASQLPAVGSGETGTSLAVDFVLAPDAVQTIRLIFTWYAPHWRSGGAPCHEDTDLHTHMYAKYYPSAQTAAETLSQNADQWLARIIRWQEVIYQDADTPGWLADALINILHLIPETSVWGQAKPPIGAWCRQEDGLFALNECPRGCPQLECLPCSFYGNVPIVYFFPQAALSTLRGYKAYQFEDGRPPWIFGGVTARLEENRPPYGLARPDKGYQTVLNAACVIDMFDRYWQISGDDAALEEFWDSLKRMNDFSMNLRPEYGESQVISMPAPGTDQYGMGDTEWFEAPEPGWKGYVGHAGAVRLAQVRMMQRMAQAMGDQDYLQKCDRWLAAGQAAFEKYLWAGRYYLNFYEPETSTRSDYIFGYQLDGQWMADWHGLPAILPMECIKTTLQTIRENNCRLSQSGAINYAKPDGTPAKVGGYGPFGYFPPELFMLAYTFMYHEEHDQFGVKLLQRCLENIVRWGYVWDFPNLTRGDMDTGQRAFGADYYQNMMLWAAPSALRRENLRGPVKEDGLVARVIKAAIGS